MINLARFLFDALNQRTSANLINDTTPAILVNFDVILGKNPFIQIFQMFNNNNSVFHIMLIIKKMYPYCL